MLLKMVDNMEDFLCKLQGSSGTMSIVVRQKVLRHVVKEILTDDRDIRVKHSIPLLRSILPIATVKGTKMSNYLLC